MPNSSPQTDAGPRGATVPDDAATFDPARHLTADGTAATDQPVYLELACQCGAIRKQYDPPAYLVAATETWRAQHDRPGHGPASIAEAHAEREARREAAYRANGTAHQYEPRTAENLPTETTTWPDLATAGTAAADDTDTDSQEG